MTSEPDYALSREWYDHKSAFMEKTPGKEHGMVMHAIIPYAIAGGLDLYYYPHGIPVSTGIHTWPEFVLESVYEPQRGHD
jgi:hypothetical protein